MSDVESYRFSHRFPLIAAELDRLRAEITRLRSALAEANEVMAEHYIRALAEAERERDEAAHSRKMQREAFEFELRNNSVLVARAERAEAALSKSQERVRVQASMLAEMDAMKCDLAAAREVIEFCATLSITDSNNADVAEDSIHEIRKCARAFLERIATP